MTGSETSTDNGTGRAAGRPAAAPRSDSTETGFIRSLFQGRLAADVLLPYPVPAPDVAETSDEVAAMVRAWAADVIDPAKIDRDATIGQDVVDGLAELGLFGLTIPEEYGGSGCKQHTYAKMMEAVAYRCPSTSTILGAHLGLGSKALLLYGTDEQKARWLPALASGEQLAAFALTEPQAGSDAAALTTTAEPDPECPGGYVLNGAKVWITNASRADFFTVFARTPHPERPDAPIAARPITAFAVTRDLGGVTHGTEESKMGLKGSSTTELLLEDVHVPPGSMLGPEGEGFKVAMNVLNGGRHSLAACCLGQAKYARDLAVAHARERVQYGRPIGSFGMVQEMLAAIEADVYAMEAATFLAADLVDRGARDVSLESACCKLFATERLWTVSNDALQIAGGTGFMHEYPYERVVRDARVNLIFEGTNQVLRMMLTLRGLKGAEGRRSTEVGAGLAGVHAEFASEREELEAAALQLGVFAEQALARHGRALREAQFVQRRLADMAVSLFIAAATLSRATASLEGTAPLLTPDLEREKATAHLSTRRLLKDFRETAAEWSQDNDALVAEVASRLTGLE